MSETPETPQTTSPTRNAARIALGVALTFAGTGHLTFARRSFQAQVPKTVTKLLPVSADAVVLASGVVELSLGGALIALPSQKRRLGAAAAALFVAVFPGNIWQCLKHDDAFGLDSDRKRAVRLLFQPPLVIWALVAGDII